MINEQLRDRIRIGLRSGDPAARSVATLALSNHYEQVEFVIDDLVAAMDKAELTNESQTPEKSVIGFGAMALSRFVEQAADSSEAVNIAKRQLLELAKSSQEAVAATGMNSIGELGIRGDYAWEGLLAACHSSVGETVKGRISLCNCISRDDSD